MTPFAAAKDLLDIEPQFWYCEAVNECRSAGDSNSIRKRETIMADEFQKFAKSLDWSWAERMSSISKVVTVGRK